MNLPLIYEKFPTNPLGFVPPWPISHELGIHGKLCVMEISHEFPMNKRQ